MVDGVKIMCISQGSFNEKGLKLPIGGYEIMAVSIKPTPVIKGEAAKKIIANYEKPVNKSKILKEIENEPKIFVMK